MGPPYEQGPVGRCRRPFLQASLGSSPFLQSGCSEPAPLHGRETPNTSARSAQKRKSCGFAACALFVVSAARDRTLGVGYFGLKPTVNDADTLRPDISVRMSPGAAALDLADAALTAVMAWLLVRLLTASRSLDCDRREDPRTV
jgi:hypothetical protein